jgi:hypothetical protein
MSGSPVSLVGITTRPQRSSSGVRLVPDTDLDHAPEAEPGLLLLPGGKDYAIALARDPRVLRYLNAVLGAGGRIAADRVLETVFPDLPMAVIRPLPTDWRAVQEDLDDIRGSQGRGWGFLKTGAGSGVQGDGHP